MKNLSIIITLISFAFPAASQVRLTLEQCVDSALSRNPLVAAAALDVEKARLMKGTAFDAPYTDIILKQETTGGGGPENGVAFSQEFEFPSVYTSRWRQLDALYRLEQERFKINAAKVTAEVESAYHAILHSQELLLLNRQLGEVYEKFLTTASVRYSQGESGRLEVINAERMVEKNRMERSNLEAQHATDVGRLRLLINSNVDILPPEGSRQFEILFAPTDSFDFSATLRGVEARELLTLADREIAVAKNQLLPGITLGATVQALIKSFNPYHIERERFRHGNLMAFEVGISVPLFFGAPRARLKAAKAEKAAVMLRNEYAVSDAGTEVDLLTQQAAALKSRLDRLREMSLPRADEIIGIAEVSYLLGEIDYIEYISNMETAYSIYRDMSDTLNDYNQKTIQLKEITAGQ